MIRPAAIALLVALTACPRSPEGIVPGRPIPLEALRTTSGEIAVANLEAGIAADRRALELGRGHARSLRASLIEQLARRGRFLGNVADLEEARALADRWVRDLPDDAEGRVARARASAALHRFDAASADLDRGRTLAGDTAAIRRGRAALLQARGRLREARAIAEAEVEADPGYESLALRAGIDADLGRHEDASRSFAAAARAYADVSPFPIVALEHAQARMWQRAGRLERAREFLEAGLERLPAFARARGDLGEVEAALGRPERAAALLEPLAETSDDPDYAAQLARILLESGEFQRAAAWREKAEAGFTAVLEREPGAFADHAAEYWIDVGGDPRRGLALALENLALRPTGRAVELSVRAALAAGDRAAACASLARAAAVEVAPAIDEPPRCP